MAAGAASGIWRLPDGVVDGLPAYATRLERLRRQLLDQLAVHGYELVYTPFIEFTESLLSGSASADLDQMTFKLVDPVSGRLMGIRADMTPQVARIDAHVCAAAGVARYCYAATVLHTQPQGLSLSRTPLQLGAELYGSNDPAADLEIIGLMLDTVVSAGVERSRLHLDLGHVGIFRTLARLAHLSPDQESQLFDIYQRKSLPELSEAVRDLPLGDAFTVLGRFTGDVEQLAHELSDPMSQSVPLREAVGRLGEVVLAVRARYPQITVGVDASELRGYHYHTGLVFTTYMAGSAAPLAQGGRYDEIGLAFGRARAATGFSCDLYNLVNRISEAARSCRRVAAPCEAQVPAEQREALRHRIDGLRTQGDAVVTLLRDEVVVAPRFTDQLVFDSSGWVLQPVPSLSSLEAC